MFVYKNQKITFVQIVKAVVSHEAALKAQAKKMNVESLRSGDQSGESAEIKIAKVLKSPYKTILIDNL